jgi:hypothetical protein
MPAVVVIKCFVSQIKLSACIIKRNVPEMGKSDAVVTIDCNLHLRLSQCVRVLLVWKLAERPGKCHNVRLSDVL